MQLSQELTQPQDKKAVADNITQQARYAKALFIWTDCDREGEHIGSEVRQAALKGNQRLQVKRARFSNTERAYVAEDIFRRANIGLILCKTCYRSGFEPHRPR